MKHIAILAALIISQVAAWAGPVPVDISRYLNNDGISVENAVPAKGLDSGGYSFPAEELPAGPVVLGGIPFLIGPGSPNDNISCKGQTISLPSGRFTKIHVLAAAVNGSFIDYATVVRTGGSSYKVDLAVSDWCTPANYNEQTGIQFTHRHASKQSDSIKCRIWKQTIHLKTTGKLATAIRLPNKPEIHIFAVTVE